LVTGGAGFIGVNFVNHWAQAHPEHTLVVLDALTYAGNRASLAPLEGSGRIEFVEGDICDAALVARVMTDYRTDTIVHFAAESHVDRSITGPDEFIRTNLQGTHVLACRCPQRLVVGLGLRAPFPSCFYGRGLWITRYQRPTF
jgi:dTDP-glucose 4,6-dehydratase